MYVAEDHGLKSFNSIRDFHIHWPPIEREVLADYENTEHINLQIIVHIGSRLRAGFTFDLVRRSYEPTIERVHDYKIVVAEWSPNNREEQPIVALEKACDAIILSHS